MKLYSVKRKEFLVCRAVIGHILWGLKAQLNTQRQTGRGGTVGHLRDKAGVRI